MQGFSTYFSPETACKKKSQKPLVKKMSKVHLMSVSVAHLLWPSSFFFFGGGHFSEYFFVRVVAHLIFLPLAHLTE